jgi:DNA-binding NarL/FixJ family response regulator
MSHCIAILSDLIFSSRITGTASQVGATCKIVKDLASLQDSLEAGEVDSVLMDLSCDGLAFEEAIRTIKSKRPGVRIVAFCSHVQTELMTQAKSAGADLVLPRSAFVQQLPQLLSASNGDC